MLKNKQRGFTIVELLVVIVIIGILAALIINAFNGMQAKARDTQRITDLKNVQKAVETYYADHGSYPLSANGSGAWAGHCPSYGNYDEYIVGLAPTYLKTLPVDPKYDTSGYCYLYRSTGMDYMVITHQTMESICEGDPSAACNPDYIRSLDRFTYIQPTIAVYSPGAKTW